MKTPRSACAVKGTDEGLDLRPANRVVCRVSLGLNVDPIKAKHILPDDPIEALVPAAAEMFSRAGSPAVAHSGEQAQDQLLQEYRVAILDPLEQLGGERRVRLLDRLLKLLPGRGLLWLQGW